MGNELLGCWCAGFGEGEKGRSFLLLGNIPCKEERQRFSCVSFSFLPLFNSHYFNKEEPSSCVGLVKR